MNYTPIQQLESNIYIKREDLIPYSFGGNKARKGALFFDLIDSGNYDCVLTYGSSHSNHCRIISNMAAKRNLKCYIVEPNEVSDVTYNSKFMTLFRANIISVPVEQVHNTIENKLAQLKKQGLNPFFIPGGGHGNIGTQAYVNCYEEIRDYERKNHIRFDYIFLASGTGTTQAGLICGQIMHGDDKKIVGISIARKNPRGRDIILDSIREYIPNISEKLIQERTIFIDDYVGEGYGQNNSEIFEIIKNSLVQYGIPMDSTYTAKAFWGMKKYMVKHNIKYQNILFIHTGGTPLFFDDIEKITTS